ncbi:MAG TPA: hypothetical protein V6C95_16865 [Coleofasciculaceae cyanobacterium]
MIPIIIGAAALGSAAIGAIAGAAGMADIDLAKKIGERAQERHERAVTDLKAKFEATNELAGVYGQLQLRIKLYTIGRFVSFVERIGQRASQGDMRFLEGLDISVQQFQEYRAIALEAEKTSKGLVSAAGAGVAAGAGAVGMAQAFGTVAVPQLFGLFTTEVAVSQLGAAGVFTYLGGGSMALGGALLGSVALGPALMVGGFQLAGKGDKALTQARRYAAQAYAKIAQIEVDKEFLQQIEQQITQLGQLAHKLESQANTALHKLESTPFERKSDIDTVRLQQVMLLVKALAEIIKTPVLNSEGKLNFGTVTLLEKYRNLGDN